MLLVQTELRDSAIEGKGLFLTEQVRKGQLLAVFTLPGKIGQGDLRYGLMAEEEYLRTYPNDEVVAFSGARLIDHFFVYKNRVENEDFTNHSSAPTMLYHCGMGFALRDMNPGEELLCDYQHFFAEGDFSELGDEKVYGLPPREALRRSATLLLKLLDETAEQQPVKRHAADR